MKLLIILFLSFNLYAHHPFNSKYGFVSSGTLLSNFEDARIVLSKWLENIAIEHNGKAEVKFYSEYESLYTDFKNKKLNMIALEMPFFFKNKEYLKNNSSNFWSLATDKTKYSQYVFLANKSLNAKSFKDIKNKTLSIKKEEVIADVWLDKNSLLGNKSSYKRLLKELKYENKESTAILNVFFKKTDFAVVSSKTWNTMIELNPSIKKKIEIVSKSKKIHLPFIGLFDKHTDKETVNAFFELSDKLKSLSGSKQIISLLKFDSIFRVDDKSLKVLENYYDEYFKLKEKYR